MIGTNETLEPFSKLQNGKNKRDSNEKGSIILAFSWGRFSLLYS